MSNVPEGAQLSEDGQWWWDGSQWQSVSVESGALSEPYGADDGGLPPGGTWQQRAACEVGPCPTCASEQSMSSPCISQAWHEGDHECTNGHSWGPAAQAKCTSRCSLHLKTCELDDLHTSAGIKHEHYVDGGGSHQW